MAEFNRERPQLSVTVSKDHLKQVRQEATARGVSVSDVVGWTIQHYFRNRPSLNTIRTDRGDPL